MRQFGEIVEQGLRRGRIMVVDTGHVELCIVCIIADGTVVARRVLEHVCSGGCGIGMGIGV